MKRRKQKLPPAFIFTLLDFFSKHKIREKNPSSCCYCHAAYNDNHDSIFYEMLINLLWKFPSEQEDEAGTGFDYFSQENVFNSFNNLSFMYGKVAKDPLRSPSHSWIAYFVLQQQLLRRRRLLLPLSPTSMPVLLLPVLSHSCASLDAAVVVVVAVFILHYLKKQLWQMVLPWISLLFNEYHLL